MAEIHESALLHACDALRGWLVLVKSGKKIDPSLISLLSRTMFNVACFLH